MLNMDKYQKITKEIFAAQNVNVKDYGTLLGNTVLTNN